VNHRFHLARAPAWIGAGASVLLAAFLYGAGVTSGQDAGATPGFLAAMVGAVGLVVLVAAVTFGIKGAVGFAIGLLLAGWTMVLVGGGTALRVDFVLAGAGHLLAAELAYWSIEQRVESEGALAAAAVLIARAGELGILVVATVLGAWALTAVATRGPGGVLLDAVAVAAVVVFGVVVLRRSTLD
jgi:hypothetical protein